MERVCELVLVVMVTMLSHHLAAAAHPFLRDECLVMKSQDFSKFSTFDENIILHLAARNSATSPTVTLKQGSYKIRLNLEDMNHWIWYNLELNLGGENPECFLNNKQIVCAMEGTTNLMTEMKWEVEVKGAVSYVGCPEEMPVFIMEESDEIIQIPRSGNEEVLMVFPTENISIDVSVGEKKKLVCWKEGKVVLMNDGTSCQPLPKYTGQHNAQIIIKDKDFTTEEGDNGDNILKLWQVNLTGVLYIVQCTKGCHVPGTDELSTEIVEVLKVLSGILLGLIVGFVAARLHNKFKDRKESSQRLLNSMPGPVTSGNQEGSTDTSFTIQTSHDEVNDIYESYVPETSHDEVNDIYESYAPETSHDEANDIYEPFDKVSSP